MEIDPENLDQANAYLATFDRHSAQLWFYMPSHQTIVFHLRKSEGRKHSHGYLCLTFIQGIEAATTDWEDCRLRVAPVEDDNVVLRDETAGLRVRGRLHYVGDQDVKNRWVR